jgi:hypothetical protein
MIRSTRLVLLCALALVAGCSSPDRHKYSAAEYDKLGRLERGLVFAERTQRGAEHAISRLPGGDTNGKDTRVQRVADGATVDVNSQLFVRLNDALVTPPSHGAVVNGAEVADLVTKAQELVRAIEGISEYREAEVDAVRAWKKYDSVRTRPEGPAAYDAFIDARKGLSDKEQYIIDRAMEVWPEDSPEFHDVDTEVNKMLLGDAQMTQKFSERVQIRLNSLSADLQSFSTRTRRRAESGSERLVIEAALIPGSDGEKATNVHVENYDNLDEGKVQRIDSLGLRLTEAERAELARLTSETRAVAAALERLREGEATFEEIVAELSTETVRGLAQLVEDVRALQGAEFQRRSVALRKAAKAFEKDLGARLKKFADDKKGEWETDLEHLIASSKALETVASTIQTVDGLRARWAAAKPADIPALVQDTVKALTELAGPDEDEDGKPDMLNAIRTVVAEAKGLLTNITTDVEGAPTELLAVARDVWKESDLQREIETWSAWLDRMQARTDSLARLVKGAHAPVRTNITNPNAFSLPLAEARDGRIDLRRTPRKAGDHLQVRAKLLRSGDSVDTVEPDYVATFELAKLGWHADLIPSIVFVEGDKVAGADDSGGFSAALNWMWNYGPRDDDDDPYLSRSLGWSAGLHAVFLNFGPDNDAEIGLGATVGLWNQTLQFGVGYNPMADSDEDGRVYYFIGSSLVPLLQALAPDGS